MERNHAPTAPIANKRQLRLVLVLTAAYLGVEAVGGLLTGSLALLSDAAHTQATVAGLGLALLAVRLAERPELLERPRDYHRAEALGALVNAVFLMCLSIFILYLACKRLPDPPPVASSPVLLIAAAGFLVKAAGVILLRGAVGVSPAAAGANFGLLSGLIASAAVLAAGVLMLTNGGRYADTLVSAGIGLCTLPRAWSLLKDSAGSVLEVAPPDVNQAALRGEVEAAPGVAGAHDLHVWSLAPGVNAMSVHVVLSEGAAHDETLARVRERVISGFKIAHVTVQVESEGCAGAKARQ